MDAELLDLIRGSRADENTNYTHVSYYGPAGKWYIKSNELAGFWDRYCQLASKNVDNGKCNLQLSLAEKPQDIMPVLVRCCLKFDNDLNFKRYDPTFIMGIVYCYQEAILELFQVSDNCTELLCCVLEPEKYQVEGNMMICQFALQFPYCRIETGIQMKLLRPRVLQLLRSENIFNKLPQTPLNDWENIIEVNTANEPWPLYRSVIHPDDPDLLLTHIYGKIDKENLDDDDDESVELELEDAFDPLHHAAVHQGLIPATLFANNKDRMYWLPLFLSVGYYPLTLLPKAHVAKKLYNHSPSTTKTSSTKASSTRNSYMSASAPSDDPMDIIDRLLPLLNRERVENDHYWLDVGKAIYNTDRSEHGLNLWIRFTERSDVHSADDCRTYYPTFGLDNVLTYKTIAWYARLDSPEAYEDWHKQWCLPMMMKATTGSHTDVATALYRIYWLDFVCASVGKRRWYHFTNHKWTELDDGVTLRRKFSTEFKNRFEKISTDLSWKRQEATEERDKHALSVEIKKIETLIGKLGTVHFKQSVMREAAELFHNDKFDDSLDANHYLMGLLNGILEVCDGYACVREGKPEDYVSKSCNIYWMSNFTWKHPLVERCMKWMRQVFPDPQLLHYSLKLFASCLKGRNSDKIFPVLTGEGDNSKSMIKKLFEAAFGSYCHTFPTTLLTAKRSNSSAPNPELAGAKNTRTCFLQEPNSDDTFQNGVLKELTGGDKFFARLLNHNGGPLEATFKLLFLCNKVPVIPTSDKAVKNRLRIVPFLSKWVHDAPEAEEEQFKQRRFKIDIFFEKKIPEMAPAFMWILVQYYEKYVSEGLAQPQIITDHTNEYWRDSDIYQQFIEEYITTVYLPGTTTPDPSSMVSLSDAFKEFKFWYRDSFPGVKVPDRSTVKTELSLRFGRKPTREGWAGIQIIKPVTDVNILNL